MSGTRFADHIYTVTSLSLYLLNFNDTPEKILYGHGIDIARDGKCRAAAVGPTAVIDERRFQFLYLLEEPALPLHLLLARCPKPSRDIEIASVEVSILFRAANEGITLLGEKIVNLVRSSR